jgi:hypothetical protein
MIAGHDVAQQVLEVATGEPQWPGPLAA